MNYHKVNVYKLRLSTVCIFSLIIVLWFTKQVKHLRMWIFDCKDPSYQAYKLGMAAAVLLAFAHVLANLLGGCICIWSKADYKKATANKQLAVGSLILSWYVNLLSML